MLLYPTLTGSFIPFSFNPREWCQCSVSFCHHGKSLQTFFWTKGQGSCELVNNLWIRWMAIFIREFNCQDLTMQVVILWRMVTKLICWYDDRGYWEGVKGLMTSAAISAVLNCEVWCASYAAKDKIDQTILKQHGQFHDALRQQGFTCSANELVNLLHILLQAFPFLSDVTEMQKYASSFDYFSCLCLMPKRKIFLLRWRELWQEGDPLQKNNKKHPDNCLRGTTPCRIWCHWCCSGMALQQSEKI